MKYNSKRILVGIEDSESSTHALEYVADLARGDGGFVIHAFHAIGPVPVGLREFGGAENPRTERQLDSQLQQKCDHWIRTAKTEARLLLENAKRQLIATGISESAITTSSFCKTDKTSSARS